MRNDMKKLLIYYSLTGNCDYVAEVMRKFPQTATEKLLVEKQPPLKGLGKFLHGGKSALLKEDPGLKPIKADPSDYDEIVLCYPVWAGTCPPAINAFVKRYSLKGKRLFIIAASASGNGNKSIEQLRKALNQCEFAGSLNLINPAARKEETVRKLAEVFTEE